MKKSFELLLFGLAFVVSCNSSGNSVGQQVTPTGFVSTGSMATTRLIHTATLLGDGKVLVAGGQVDVSHLLATAELYDPASGSFTPTGSMQAGRSHHTATLLKDGKVLLAGGATGTETNAVATAELYDPAGGTFTPTGNEVTLAELFDSTTGNFSLTGSMGTAREYHTSTLLNGGKVLVTGGVNGSGALATAELFE